MKVAARVRTCVLRGRQPLRSPLRIVPPVAGGGDTTASNNVPQCAAFLAQVAGAPSRTPLRGFVADGSGPGAQAALRPLSGAFAPRGHYCAACTLAALWAANGQKSEKPAPVFPEGFSPAPLPSPPPPLGAPGKRRASLAGCGPPTSYMTWAPPGCGGILRPVVSLAHSHCTGSQSRPRQVPLAALTGPVPIVGARLDKCEHLCYDNWAGPVSGAFALHPSGCP